MNFPLEIINHITENPISFIERRLDLNLPNYHGNFSFRVQQKEALELGLSNFPLVIIGGNPGSGKTTISKEIANIAIENQSSILMIANYQSSLNQYHNLKIKPLQINRETEYHQNVKIWLKSKFTNPKIDFNPPYLFPDVLFDSQRIYQWLSLFNDGNQEELKQQVKQIFPFISDDRYILLMAKMQRFSELISQREYLKQSYQNISDNDLEKLTQLTINSINLPQICLTNNIEAISNQVFDLVIVEDSHLLKEETIKVITNYSQKLILLGQLDKDSFFKELFYKMSPAYRINIEENHRLTIDLARKIFPYFFYHYPYTPMNNFHGLNNISSENSLIWHDVVNSQQMIIVLKQYQLEKKVDKMLTFSAKTFDFLQQQLNLDINNELIKLIDDWHGEETDNLLIILDNNNEDNPSLEELKLALTRAKYSLTIIGSKTAYENSHLAILFDDKLATIKRDLVLK